MSLPLDPKVSIVVIPRERFNVALQSLDSIFRHTREPYNLIYIDVNSPPYIYEGLKERQEKYGFTLIRKDHFIYPNEARNLGLEHAHTPYLVFIDNDILVTENWLDALMKCAEETGAWLVGPLILETDGNKKTLIHSTGSETVFDEDSGIVTVRMIKHKNSLEDLTTKERCPSEILEFHCILIKTEGLRAIGGKLDEGVKTTRHHMDLCFSIKKAGGKLFFEPESLVKYIRYYPIEDKYDEDFVKFCYDEAATLETISYIEKKWNVKLEPWRPKILRNRKNKILGIKKGLLGKVWFYKKFLRAIKGY